MADFFAAEPVKGVHVAGDAPGATEYAIAVLPVVANAAAPALTEATLAHLSTDLSGNLRVTMAASAISGGLTNNNAAPAANNLGVLPALAVAAAPTYTAGDQVLLTTDVNGNLRVVIDVAATADSAANPLFTALSFGGAAVAAGNPLPVVLDVGTTADTLANPLGVALSQGGAAVSAANPTFVTPGTGSTFVVVGNKAGNAASPDSLGVEVYPAVATAAVPTYTASDLVSLSTDLSGRLRAILDSSSAPSLTANGAVVATANPLPVGLEIAGAAVTAANPVPVIIELSGSPDGPANPLPVYQIARGTVRDSGQLTTPTLAPGGTTTLAHPTAQTNSAHILEVTASSSVRVKVDIQSKNGAAAAVTLRTFVVDPIGAGLAYKTPDAGTLVIPTGTTVQMKFTNLDNNLTADVYGSITYSDF